MPRILLLLLSVLTSPFVFAQIPALRFDNLTVDNGLAQNTIQGIVQDKYGFMWFGTLGGLCKYDGYSFTVYKSNDKDSHSIINDRIHSVCKDTNQVIWIAFSDSKFVCRYNYEEDNFTRFSSNQMNASLLQALKKGAHTQQAQSKEYTWQVSSDNFLTQTSHKTGQTLVYRADPLYRWGLRDEFVNDVYLDANQTLWVGTSNIGISKADTKQKPFANFSKEHLNPNSLVDNIVKTICEDSEGNLWVGTRNKGITKMNRKTGKYTHFQQNALDPTNSLVSNHIRKIYADHYGFIWIGTKNGLNRYDPKTNRFSLYKSYTKNAIPHNWVFDITEDHQGNLWIGTWRGIAKYDRKRDRFFAYEHAATLKSSYVRAIVADRQNNLWVATEGGGITRLKRVTTSALEEKLYPTHFTSIPANPNSLSNDRVITMIEDEAGLLWIGTSSGLNRFEPATGKFTRFTTKEGLADDLIMGLLCDGKGHVWISHKRGISRLNTRTFAIRNYTKQDGLQDNEFSAGACFRSPKTGELFFGGINGFNAFFPKQIQSNPYPPILFFTNLKILNKTVPLGKAIDDRVILSKPLYLTDEITLEHADKNIDIEFAALHYANPQANRYAYMLEGFDKDWIYTDASKRTASYSNLEAGTYAFKVKASNSDGVWSAVPKKIAIVMLPPWWRTNWAYAFYGLCVVVLLYLFYRYIIAREQVRHQLQFERMQAERKYEQEQEKVNLFINVSHEFRTPLTLLLQPLHKLLALDTSPEIEKAAQTIHLHTQKLLGLVNQLLDFRKVDEGKAALKRVNEDIIGFTNNIVTLFGDLAAAKKLDLQFHASVATLDAWIDPDKYEKILTNVLSNAIKFTDAPGKITVSVAKIDPSASKIDWGFAGKKESQESVEIRIRDTGIGLTSEQQQQLFGRFYHADDTKAGTGLGLAYTKSLVELHGGQIYVESEYGKGTTFSIQLPLGSQSEPKRQEIEKELQTPTYAYATTRLEWMKYEIIHTDPSVADELAGEFSTSLEPGEETHSLPLLLLVEDNKELRTQLKESLKSHYRIKEAANGLEGWEKTLKYFPDIIISDIMMPKMTGIELCGKLKEDIQTCHIPLILLTAKGLMDNKIEGFETGADEYISKPFHMPFLFVRIKSLLESRTRLKEKFASSTYLLPAKEITTNNLDEAFLDRITKIALEHISDPQFTLEEFLEKIGMSYSNFFRKISALTGKNPSHFLRSVRLQYASELLLQRQYTIKEIGYMAGFNSPSYFNKTFRELFGMTPLEYLEHHSDPTIRQ